MRSHVRRTRKHTLRSTKRKRPNKRQKGKVRNGGIEIEVGESEKATTNVVESKARERKERNQTKKANANRHTNQKRETHTNSQNASSVEKILKDTRVN